MKLLVNATRGNMVTDEQCAS